MIAASATLAVGGSLALTATASAVQIPFGTPTSTDQTSVYGILNNLYGGLKKADTTLAGVGDTAVPAPASFPPEFASGSTAALSSAQALQIAADFSGSTVGGVAPSSATYAAELKVGDPTYTTDSENVKAAGEGWAADSAQLSDLVTQLAPFGGTLYSLDSGVTVSSAATVTGIGKPTAYSITGATSGSAASGYVLPSGFTMTFPNAFSVNIALAGAELPASDEPSPPAASAIGTVTLKTPVATLYGGSNGQITGQVFVINANGSITQPDLELYFPTAGAYLLGTFPKTLTFPLTMTFGEATLPGGTQDPLPFSSVTISFPPRTSPVKALNCTNLGTVGGTGTDEIASLAAEFGDSSDGGTITFGSTPTLVTDLCPPKAGATRIAGIKRNKPTLKIVIKSNGSTRFKTATITLPSGLTARGLKAKDLRVAGARLRSVSGRGAKVTLNFRSATRSATVTFNKGLAVSAKLAKAVTKHRTKSLNVKFTVKYAPLGMAATTSAATTVKVKGLS